MNLLPMRVRTMYPIIISVRFMSYVGSIIITRIWNSLPSPVRDAVSLQTFTLELWPSFA